MGGFKPSKGDLRFQEADRKNGNDFDTARLLRDVSHEYIAVMLSSNAGPTSAGFRALLEAELSRRSSRIAHRANWIAAASLAISVLAVVIAVVTR